jgi:AraC family transcriptional regulator
MARQSGLTASSASRDRANSDAHTEETAVTGRICLIGQDGRTREAFPAPPVLSSSGAPWSGLLLEQHRLPSFDAPEVTLLEPFLTITVEGAGEIEVKLNQKSERQAALPGTVCVMGQGPVPPIHVGGSITSIFISVRSSMLAEYAADLVDCGEARLNNAYSVPDPHFFHIAMALRAEIEEGYPGGRLYGESLTIAMVAHLLTCYSPSKPAIDACRGGIGPRRLRLVLDYIDHNLASDLSIAELAAVVRMSPFRFARLFKEAAGVAPHQFVLRKRIARARSMLEASAAPLSEISASLGFESQSHFTAVFHRLIGTTPRAYRERHRV